MSETSALLEIKRAIANAPRNAYVAELHLQIIKHADELQNVAAKDFCEAVGLTPAFGTEFLKMRKIAPRLKAAGVDPSKI